jgi:hypothetical protein
LLKEYEPPSPDVAEALKIYNEQLEGTDYRGVYNPITKKIDRISTKRGGTREGKESGKGELFLKLISNMDYPEAKKFTEDTYKGFTLVLGKTGDYEIVDKNKEVDPVEAGNMLGDLFARTKRDVGEFSPRKIQEMRKELMTGDPQKILELESALYAGGLLREFQNKIAQSGDPNLEVALTKAVSEWYLGATEGTIFQDKTAPQSEGELVAQIQEFLSATYQGRDIIGMAMPYIKSALQYSPLGAALPSTDYVDLLKKWLNDNPGKADWLGWTTMDLLKAIKGCLKSYTTKRPTWQYLENPASLQRKPKTK